MVALHAVDYAAVGLADFGRPDGYLERQLKRWRTQWEANRTAPLPEIDALLARLARALPAHSDAALVHGDFRFGNMALDPGDPGPRDRGVRLGDGPRSATRSRTSATR
jgi:aminoglycoside phosphotransferase (APT) family kinase protein